MRTATYYTDTNIAWYERCVYHIWMSQWCLVWPISTELSKKRIIRVFEENHKSQNMSINGGLFCPHMHVPQYKHSLTLMHGDNPTHGKHSCRGSRTMSVHCQPNVRSWPNAGLLLGQRRPMWRTCLVYGSLAQLILPHGTLSVIIGRQTSTSL